jgi:protein gp37
VGQVTDIGWADSSLNIMMGCDGCELWNPKTDTFRCYAGVLTSRVSKGGPSKGWPDAFDKPRIFSDRLREIQKWKDLTGTQRPDKPNLDGLPRHIFMNDMGDTWTESLAINWMAPYVVTMEDAPHRFMFLTKRVPRMLEFFKKYPGAIPKNFILGTTITGKKTAHRAEQLASGDYDLVGNARLFLSIEPLWDDPKLSASTIGCYNLVIIGGESGTKRKDMDLKILQRLVDMCRAAGVAVYVKQDSALRPGQQGRIPDELYVQDHFSAVWRER